MSKIRLQRTVKTIWYGDNEYYFTNTGDIRIIPGSSWGASIYNKEGAPIFCVGMAPKTFIFGYTNVLILDKTHFDFAPELLSEINLLCFDPRIVMTNILIDILIESHGADDNAWIKHVQEAINPVPTIE